MGKKLGTDEFKNGINIKKNKKVIASEEGDLDGGDLNTVILPPGRRSDGAGGGYAGNAWSFSSGAGSPTGNNNSGGGGGGDGNNASTPNPIDPPNQPDDPNDKRQNKPDPCADGKNAANKANDIKNGNNYNNAVNKINEAKTNNTNEHLVFLNPDGSMGLDPATNQPYTNNNSSSVNLTANLNQNPNATAAMHNHPLGTPVSSGDFYALVASRNQGFINFNTIFSVSGNEIYAFVLTDIRKANAFCSKFPKGDKNFFDPNIQNLLMELMTEFGVEPNNISSYNNAYFKSMSAILSQYDAGVKMVKQENINADFKSINANTTINTNTNQISNVGNPSDCN